MVMVVREAQILLHLFQNVVAASVILTQLLVPPTLQLDLDFGIQCTRLFVLLRAVEPKVGRRKEKTFFVLILDISCDRCCHLDKLPQQLSQ